jgi:small-conductance mechanosensitive channel
METLTEFLTQQMLNPATVAGAITYGVIFLLMAVVASRLLRTTLVRVFKPRRGQVVGVSTALFATDLGQLIIYVTAFLFYAQLVPALRSLGTAMLTGVSVFSVILGVAAQQTLGNLIAGVALQLYRPFKVGDNLQMTAPTGLESGTVERVTLGYTVIKAPDHRRIVVPNSIIANQATINLSHARALATVSVPINYGADVEQARKILTELGAAHPLVREVVSCPVTQLGEYIVTLSLRAWCGSAADASQVQFDLYEQARKRFDQDGIAIPSPSMQVTLKQTSE